MAGVYISFPFCAQKCTYCNFASGVLPAELEAQYLESLEREIRAWRFEWTPETVYFGGGTPSRIEPGTLRRLLDAVRTGGGFREATLEAAPGTFSEAMAAGWAEAGINRVSLGAQSFVTRELARTGRKHRAEHVEADVATLGRNGITNVNVDLIAGLPGQTRESWSESLNWIERLAPNHVSVYMLEIDEDSRLGNEILLGGVRYGAMDRPSEELTVELYEKAAERLAAIGIPRYEISNFARPGFESAHNLKYWRMEPYIGFGADAHSFDGRNRWRNVEDARDYVSRGGLAREPMEPARVDEERLFTGLRLASGVVARAEDWSRFGNPIRQRIAEGLLEQDGDILRLTPRGILFSNEVFSDLITL